MGIIDSVLSIGSTILDRVIPDVNAREKAKQELEKALSEQDFQLALGQIQINQEEAKSENIFKSGWRPSIGHAAILIPFDTNTLMTVLGGLLGIGGLRTIEKIKGVN